MARAFGYAGPDSVPLNGNLLVKVTKVPRTKEDLHAGKRLHFEFQPRTFDQSLRTSPEHLPGKENA